MCVWVWRGVDRGGSEEGRVIVYGLGYYLHNSQELQLLQ